MAALTTTYTLELTEQEAVALKTLLGGMNDDEFAQFSIKGEDRSLMGGIYDLLPHDED